MINDDDFDGNFDEKFSLIENKEQIQVSAKSNDEITKLKNEIIKMKNQKLKSRKNRKSKKNQAQHKFVGEVKVSDDLAEFLGVQKGSSYANQGELTAAVWERLKYINQINRAHRRLI